MKAFALFVMRIDSDSSALVVLGFRLQGPVKRYLWELQQWMPRGRHGSLRSWEVHTYEHSGWVQVCES